MSEFKTRHEGDEYILDDPRICQALEAVMRVAGCQVIMDFSSAGAFRVRISYGTPERDAGVFESFDAAEWGASKKSLEEALRFALGQHYHQE